jgi:hypothetical protein
MSPITAPAPLAPRTRVVRYSGSPGSSAPPGQARCRTCHRAFVPLVGRPARTNAMRPCRVARRQVVAAEAAEPARRGAASRATTPTWRRAEPARGRPCPTRACHRACPGGAFDPGVDPRGAKARTTGLGCRAPAMANGRCPAGQARGQAPHGGGSTGPRTPEGLARLAAARTKHGGHGAAWRAMHRYQRTVIARSRVLAAAFRLGAHLPPDMAARMALAANELAPPRHPSRGPAAMDEGTPGSSAERGGLGRDGRFVARSRPALRGRMLEREAARSEAAMLAPWRAGIAWARVAERAAGDAAHGQGSTLSLPPGTCPGGGRCGRTGWLPGRGLSRGRGRGPQNPDKTL